MLSESQGASGQQRRAGKGSLNEVALNLGLDGWEI